MVAGTAGETPDVPGPQPWVELALRDGLVLLDGERVGGPGSREDRYLAALRRVAEEIATPLGRPVGVTVRDARGVVTHLAIHPDGTAEAVAPPPAAGQAPRPAPVPASRHRRRREGTLVPVLAAAVLAAAVAAGALVLHRPGEPDQGAGGPTLQPRPSATVGEVVVRTRWRPAGPALVADVRPHGPGALRVLVGATRRPATVRLALLPSDGAPLRRTVVLHGDIADLTLGGLPDGPLRWRVETSGARPLTGTVRVPALPVAPAPSPPPPSASTEPVTTSSGGAGRPARPHGHRTPGAAPLIPIDPDDQ